MNERKKEVVRMIKPHFRKARFCSGITFARIARTVPFHAIEDDAVIYLSSDVLSARLSIDCHC